MIISGKKLKRARELKGITQNDLIRKLGSSMNKANVSMWENGVDIPLKYYDQLISIFGKSELVEMDKFEEVESILNQTPESIRETFIGAIQEYNNDHESEPDYLDIDGAEKISMAIKDIANHALKSINRSSMKFYLDFASASVKQNDNNSGTIPGVNHGEITNVVARDDGIAIHAKGNINYDSPENIAEDAVKKFMLLLNESNDLDTEAKNKIFQTYLTKWSFMEGGNGKG